MSTETPWTPATPFEPPAKTFTPEEIERYASYHWVQFDTGLKLASGLPIAAAHVWRTIGGETKYLGTTRQIERGEEPSVQYALDFSARRVEP